MTNMKKKTIFFTCIIIFFVIIYMNKHVIDRDILNKRYSERDIWSEVGFLGYLIADVQDTVLRMRPADEKELKEMVDAFYSGHSLEAYHFPERKPAKNVILLQLEGVDSVAIDLEKDGELVLKNLHYLKENGIWYSNVYDQTGSGRTSDGEFLALTSLLPVEGESMYTHYDLSGLTSLPKVMSQNGRHTMAFHGNDGAYWNRKNAHMALGYQEGIYQDDCTGEIEENYKGWGLSDGTILKETYDKIVNSDSPVFTHTILLTGHHPYEAVNDMELDLPYAQPDSLVEKYINCLFYTDMVVGEFVHDLERAGILEDCLLVIFADHDSGVTKEIYRYMGLSYDGANIECDKIPLIIYDGLNAFEETDIMGQADIMPLILSYLDIEFPPQIMGANYVDGNKTVYLKGNVVFNDHTQKHNEFNMSEMTKALISLGEK